MEEQRGLGGGGRPRGRREVVEKEGGCGGGGRPWGRREAVEEEGGRGGGERPWRRREVGEEMCCSEVQKNLPHVDGNISHTSLEQLLQEKAGTRGGD